MPPKKQSKLDAKWLMFSSMGLELGLSVIVGIMLGRWMDDYFGTKPWLLLLGLILGMVAGYRSVYRLLKRLKRLEQEADNHTDQSPESSK